MNRTTLLKLHQQQIQNNENNDENTIRIVQILGGIDNILTTYLKNPDIALYQNEIQKIHHIITSPPQKDKSLNEIQVNIDPYNTGEDEATQSTQTVILDPHDHFLSTIFGKQKSSKIINILRHKVTLTLIFLLIIYHTISDMIDRQLYLFSVVFGVSTFGFPIIIFWMLSVNKIVLKYLLLSFDFWIKCFYAIMFIFSSLLYQFTLTSEMVVLEVIASIMFQIILLCVVITIGALDGYRLHTNLKIIMSLIPGVFFFFHSLRFQFLRISYTNGDHSEMRQYRLLSMMSDACRVIAIFFVKQAYTIYIGKGVYANFKHVKPKVKWMEKPETTSQTEPELTQITAHGDDIDVRKYDVPVIGSDEASKSAKQIETVLCQTFARYESSSMSTGILEKTLTEVLRLPTKHKDKGGDNPTGNKDNTNGINAWLISNGFECYLENFAQNGYHSLDSIKKINDAQQLMDIGVEIEKDQHALMTLIQGELRKQT